MSETVGTVAALTRYPVKSVVGESLTEAYVEARGLRGDRLWSVRDPDGKLGSGKSSRRFRRMEGLLGLTATYDGEVVVLTLPDGSTVRSDEDDVHQALSDVVGRAVTLDRESDVSHFDDSPVHLVTTASLREAGRVHTAPVDLRHSRPNLVVDTGDAHGWLEDGWVGRRVAVGEVVLEVVSPTPRCVMVDLPQVGLDASPDTTRSLLQDLTSSHDGDLGAYATVVTPGTLTLGAEVRLL